MQTKLIQIAKRLTKILSGFLLPDYTKPIWKEFEWTKPLFPLMGIPAFIVASLTFYVVHNMIVAIPIWLAPILFGLMWFGIWLSSALLAQIGLEVGVSSRKSDT